MKICEKGIVAGSEIYFHTPSEQARQLFFYPLCAGHFFCDEAYRVCRARHDSFQALYVAAGKGYFEQNGQCTTLRTGAMVLIDCYRPHHYWTDSGWETYWLHFDGQLARQYFALCTAGPVYPADRAADAARHLRKICDEFQASHSPSEAMISRRIVELITELMLCGTPGQSVSRNALLVDEAIGYMHEHLAEPLSVEQLAAQIHLSPYHFIRLFKSETGFTPHRYLVQLRIDLASYLLKTTDLPLKEIAWRTGFGSASNLCTAFRSSTGTTPQLYRSEEGVPL